MKNLLLSALLLVIFSSTASASSPFTDVSDYTVQFTLECGRGEVLADRVVVDFNEQPVLMGTSTAVAGDPAVSVMINPDSGDYTIVLSKDDDACVLDYGVFTVQQ